MNVLITGSSGMVGSALVKRLLSLGFCVFGLSRHEIPVDDERFTFVRDDLSNLDNIRDILKKYKIDRVIHLAALAHSNTGTPSYDEYFNSNVKCSINLFKCVKNIPILYVSTVDVYGFTNGVVDSSTEPHPVSNYSKTKYIAEKECRKLCSHFSIYRLSPVYSETCKRDIQKRYYLHYPNLAYRVGSGSFFEVVSLSRAVDYISQWCFTVPDNSISIIRDEELLNSLACINDEKLAGRASHVIVFPRFLMSLFLKIAVLFTGENHYTYLLNKAINPIRTSSLLLPLIDKRNYDYW